MHHRFAAFVLVCVAAVPCAEASTKSAQKALKAIQNAELKQFRSDTAALLDVAFAQLASLEVQVKNSAVTPKNSVEDAIDVVGPVLAEISVAAYQVLVDVAIAAEPLLAAEPTETVPGFLAGDGGVSDAFEGKLDKELAKLRGKVMKRVRAFAKVLSKQTAGDYRLAVVMPVQHVNGAARMNKVPNASGTDVIFWPTRILIALGGSSATVSNDGRLVFGLQARVWVTSGNGNGNVYLSGPSALLTSLNFTCGTVNEFGYAQTKFDNLKAGAYIAMFDQDVMHDATSGEEAFERAIVGVP